MEVQQVILEAPLGALYWTGIPLLCCWGLTVKICTLFRKIAFHQLEPPGLVMPEKRDCSLSPLRAS